mgnify:CR=1 FL=1
METKGKQPSRKKTRAAIEAAVRAVAVSGPLTADRVIAAAKDPKSPLHAWFTWDVKAAAMAYWREQARELIRSVEVTVLIEERPVEVSYFVRDPRLETATQGYVGIEDLQQNPEWARTHVQRELAAVIDRLQRTEGYATILRVKDQLLDVTRRVRKLSARIGSTAGATP